METFFPNIPENNLQILLIEKKAKELWVSSEKLSEHWIDMYSPVFRELWESWIHDIDAIEEQIYKPDPLKSNWADMVSSIIQETPDPRIEHPRSWVIEFLHKRNAR